MNTVIIGAGIAGLAAASALVRIGQPATVVESASEPGGLCTTRSREGFTFDSVSHVLHFRSVEARDFVQSHIGADLRQIQRNCTVYFKGRDIPYPFQAHIGALPSSDATACLLGLVTARLSGPPQWSNFGEWIHTTLGGAIAGRFMTPYNEKLWGIRADELATDFLRFVPSPSLRAVLKSFFGASTVTGYNSTFEYPQHGGIQSLINAVAARLPKIRLNSAVTSIDCDRRQVRIADGTTIPYDRLISTIPLPELRRIAVPVPRHVQQSVDQLRKVSILSITVAINHPDVRPQHWIYFPGRDVPFFRLFFHSNVSPSAAPEATSLVSAEISNAEASEAAKVEEHTISALLRLGIVRRRQDVRFIHSERFEYGYPVHDLARHSAVESILSYFRSVGVQSIGRFGAWHYSSIEDGILEGLAAAQDVSGLRA